MTSIPVLRSIPGVTDRLDFSRFIPILTTRISPAGDSLRSPILDALQRLPSSGEMTVTATEENNLTLVSQRLYRTVDYWWILGLLNGIEEPYQLPVGTKIKYPSIGTVESLLQRFSSASFNLSTNEFLPQRRKVFSGSPEDFLFFHSDVTFMRRTAKATFAVLKLENVYAANVTAAGTLSITGDYEFMPDSYLVFDELSPFHEQFTMESGLSSTGAFLPPGTYEDPDDDANTGVLPDDLIVEGVDNEPPRITADFATFGLVHIIFDDPTTFQVGYYRDMVPGAEIVTVGLGTVDQPVTIGPYRFQLSSSSGTFAMGDSFRLRFSQGIYPLRALKEFGSPLVYVPGDGLYFNVLSSLGETHPCDVIFSPVMKMVISSKERPTYPGHLHARGTWVENAGVELDALLERGIDGPGFTARLGFTAFSIDGCSFQFAITIPDDGSAPVTYVRQGLTNRYNVALEG